MSDTILLWTAQRPIVLDTLEREGVYRVLRSFVEQKYGESGWNFQTAYQFFVQAARQVLPPPAGAESPVWCWPDPRWVGLDGDCALLRLTVPRAQVLLFDSRQWNAILNLSYLPTDAEDQAAFERELARQGVKSPLDLFRTPFYPQLRRRVENSWKQLFAPGAALDPRYTQAAVWELRREWVEICPSE